MISAPRIAQRLRHQLNIRRRKIPEAGGRWQSRSPGISRALLLVWVVNALKILQLETVIRWHRAGFHAY
jgi:hypothetical protein